MRNEELIRELEKLYDEQKSKNNNTAATAIGLGICAIKMNEVQKARYDFAIKKLGELLEYPCALCFNDVNSLDFLCESYEWCEQHCKNKNPSEC